ncbi:DUF6538 domain-containing protein [Marinobacter sp. ELB17]|uniref:DUF6538 domain-containing protein n=1 Tax=Marinobacter sp. ELB17 TaxID=270374 RepID=UPI0029CAAC1D|nr:DUF6538 domain-containing protein [Marinobacter sp. ELB17]
MRKRVPDDLRPIIGQREIKRSLKTPDPKEATSRVLIDLAEIEQELAAYQAAYAQIFGDADWSPPSYAPANIDQSLNLPELFTRYA